MNKKNWLYAIVLIVLPYACGAQDCNALYQNARIALSSAKWDTAYIGFDAARACFKSKQLWERYTDSNRGMSFVLSRKDKYDKIPSLLLPVIDTLVKLNDKTGQNRHLIGKLHRNLGAAYLELKNPNEAIHYLNKSLERTDNIIDKIVIYANLGVAYEDKLGYEKSINYHSKALDILSDTFNIPNKTIDKVGTLNNIAQAYSRYQHYEDAQRNFETGLQLLKDFQPQNDRQKEEKKSLEVRYYTNLGTLHTKWEKYDKGLEYLNQLHKMNLSVSEMASRYHLNVGYAYLGKKNYAKASQSFMEVIRVRKQLNADNKHIAAVAYSCLGETYYKQNIWKGALDNLQQALVKAVPEFNDVKWEANPDIRDVHYARNVSNNSMKNQYSAFCALPIRSMRGQ